LYRYSLAGEAMLDEVADDGLTQFLQTFLLTGLEKGSIPWRKNELTTNWKAYFHML
jgi:hypothetical protein